MIDEKNIPQSEEEAEMTKYGITRERMDYYYVGAFRYTSLKDAIVQARRCPNSGSV